MCIFIFGFKGFKAFAKKKKENWHKKLKSQNEVKV